MLLHRLKSESDRALFSHPGGKDQRRFVFYALLALLFFAGLFLWSDFFNKGQMRFNTADWNEKYRSIDLMRQALEQRVIPYHSTTFLSIWHRDQRFLAMPHIIISPQILMLLRPDFGIGDFFLFNIRLFYTIGFFGCMLFVWRYRLSIVSTCFLLMLFNMNGYLVSHLGVGHTEWFSYFLMPYFVYFTMRLLDTEEIVLPSMGIAIVQFAILMQGGFHFTIWCMMFLASMWLFNPRRRLGLAVLSAAIQTGLLGAFRILPAMQAFGGQQLEYVPGYETLHALLDAFTVIHGISTPFITPLFSQQPIAYWEYDVYLSGFGLCFLLYFGLYRRLSAGPSLAETRFRELDPPILILFLLSVGHLYFVLFYDTHFPVIGSAERAPSRFIIMPVLFLTILACIWYQRFLDGRIASMNAGIRAGSLLGGLSAGYLLYAHFRLWSISGVDQSGIMPPVEIKGFFGPAQIQTDDAYISLIDRSFWISAVALVFWFLFFCAFWREKIRRRARKPIQSAA